MTDHAGEQEMELEALEAIFADALEEWEGGGNPAGWPAGAKAWAITILPSADHEDAAAQDEDAEPELEMQLVFAHTPTYPDEPPAFRLRSVRGLSDAELADATALLQQHIEENLGMSMIYNLVTAAQEWLAERAAAGPAGAGAGADADAEEKKRRDEEEAARAAARAHGTPVTVEAFNEWKAAYEAERKAAAASASSSKPGAAEGRLTGRQWFMQQLAAGKGESSGSEAGEEELAAYELDEDEDEDADFDFEDEDEDDDDVLEDYLAAKTTGS